MQEREAMDFYDTAFCRNIGIFSPQEQQLLRRSRVAIAGLGGVGGHHLITLARMGVGSFHVADMDVFELVNVNRQYGAKEPNFGKSKLEVMATETLSVNPYADVRMFAEGITEGNLDDFLDGVHLVLDGLDFFNFEIRRLLFNRAMEKGLHVVTAGPLGFSTAVLIFSPREGMTFDEYFDIHPGLDEEEKLLRFAMGLAPRPTHLRYMDLEHVSLAKKAGPSVASACLLCAAVAATEAVKILLGRESVRVVPEYVQIDPYTLSLRRGRLPRGNRNIIQRVRMTLVKQVVLKSEGENSSEKSVEGGRGIARFPGRCKKVLRRFLTSKPLAFSEIPDMRARPDMPPGPVKRFPVPNEVLKYLVLAAVQAPSGDNAQPWKFALDGDRIDIYMDRDRDRSFFNVNQIASIIACGAAAENIRIAATCFGLDASIEMFPDASRPDWTARILLTPESLPKDPLHEMIWRRHTNRRKYEPFELSPVVAEALRRAAKDYEGVHIHLVQKKTAIERVASVVYRVDRIRTEDRRLHEHLHKMLRLSKKEASLKRDGLPLQNLEAGLAGEIFLRLTRPWSVMNAVNRIGVGRLVALHAREAVRQASAVMLITGDAPTPEVFFKGGRLLERLWLLATLHKLALQPMTAVTLFLTRFQKEGLDPFERRHRRLLERAFADYGEVFQEIDCGSAGHVMLLRVGRAFPISEGTWRREPVMRIDESLQSFS